MMQQRRSLLLMMIFIVVTMSTIADGAQEFNASSPKATSPMATSSVQSAPTEPQMKATKENTSKTTSPQVSTPTTPKSVTTTSATAAPTTTLLVSKLPLESGNKSEENVTNATDAPVPPPTLPASTAIPVPPASQEALQSTNNGTSGKNFAHDFSPSTTTNGLITLISLHMFAFINFFGF